MQTPVALGRSYTLSIDSITAQGAGIARAEGFAVFVPGALPGEAVRAEITRVERNFAQAALSEILSPSPDRQAPPCPYFGTCGGCALMHMPYERTLEIKQKHVTDCLSRIGGVAGGSYALHPIAGMADPFRYRNKAEYAVRSRDGRILTGYYESKSHAFVPIETCLLQRAEADRAASIVRGHAAALGVPIHNLIVRISSSAELLLTLVTGAESPKSAGALILALRGALPMLRGVVQNIQPRPGGEILGRECRTLWGEGTLDETVAGLTLRTSPTSFFQVNPLQMDRLYTIVLEAAKAVSPGAIMDVYCGAGSMTLPLSRIANTVIGIDSAASAIEDAQENAARNGITNATFLRGNAERVLPEIAAKGLRAELVVLDPPRRGCEAAVIPAISACGAGRVIYVSCNPATLARDIARMGPGVRVEAVWPVDMFPWTEHVECVVLLRVE